MADDPSVVNPQLAVLIEYITSVRDVLFGGEPVIKAKGTEYLPMLPGGNSSDSLGRNRYELYKNNALFYALASRVFEGLQGACFRKDPEVFIDKGMEDELKTIYKGSESFLTLSKKALSETLAVSRFGVLVDIFDRGEVPSIVSYRSENIVNWRYGIANGAYQLTLAVLKETTQRPKAENYYEEEDVTQYRVLELVSNPDEEKEDFVYRTRVYIEKVNEEDGTVLYTVDPGSIRYPQRKGGNHWDKLPFEIIHAIPDPAKMEPPLMWPLVSANLSHFRSSASYENLVNITGFPILWGSGINTAKESKEIHIGSPIAHLFENPSATLQFATAPEGADVIRANMESKKELIVLLGGRLLQREREAVESAATHKEKKIGENSVLATTVRSVSASLTLILGYWMEFQGKSTENVGVELNTDFTADDLNPATLKELSNMLQKGLISYHTYWYNMHKYELYPDNWKKSQEISNINKESSSDFGEDEDSSDNEGDSTDEDGSTPSEE